MIRSFRGSWYNISIEVYAELILFGSLPILSS